jgi:holo-[acyl-carrier protein] synthase
VIYGIGVDLVRVERIAAAIGRYGDRFLKRLFTPGEIAYCQGRAGAAAAFALRFAAKEAFSKALGVGLRQEGIRWREVEVVADSRGKPELRVSGRAAQLCNEFALQGLHLTLSDEDNYAVAVVILEK